MKGKFTKSLRAIIIAVISIVFVLSAASCGDNGDNGSNKTNDTLVVAYSNFSNKFSPFFATSAYDVDVYGMTQIGLLAGDRGGNVIYKGIDGETVPYNGKDYTYYGLGQLEVTQNKDGSTYYDITIRSGNKTVYFSDGKPVTIKDVIFSMYAFSDTDYDGSSTFYSLPIKGMAEWRTNLSTDVLAKWTALSDEVVAEIVDNGNYEKEGYTPEQAALASQLETGLWEELAKDIVNYVAVNYPQYYSMFGNDPVATGMGLWGFGDFDDNENFISLPLGNTYTLEGDDVPDIAEYAANLKAAYGGDIVEAAGVEAANGDLDTYMAAFTEKWISENGAVEMAGATIDSISGITFDESKNSVRIETTKFDAVTVYQLALSVAPMHYYGDTSLWDPANGSYGFTRGNLDGIRSKTTKPMGAGPYKFVSYEGGIVTFEANQNYWEGSPKIKYIKFKEYNNDEDKLPALIAGDVDIAEPSINKATCDGIKLINFNNELSLKGDVVATDLLDNNGYGYIGINSELVNVGGQKGSEASKNLRKAFATLFSAYREYTVNSYYEDRASVIQYPITTVSWASPQPADEGYAIAFSKDIDGNDIYSPDDKESDKWAAALEASIGYFKAAGYTFNEETGKFTEAPTGAKLSYEAIIGGGGTGDHPTYALLIKAKEALASIGIELVITDLASSATLFAKMEEGTADMFIAAWGGASDPDMYQVYHSSNTTGSNHYRIADEELDELIMDARSSADKTFRKNVYKQCLDIILDWAVEIPVYQRKNCMIFSALRVDISSLTPDTTPFWSYLAEIHKVEMK